jgi:hypothetical protein
MLKDHQRADTLKIEARGHSITRLHIPAVKYNTLHVPSTPPTYVGEQFGGPFQNTYQVNVYTSTPDAVKLRADLYLP